MTLLAVPSEQGGLTGWLPDLVETLGPSGVGPGGSLIWNTVLVSLGVAAGDFIRENLHYLEHLVVAALLVAVAWFVCRKASGKLPRPATAGRDLPADERDGA